MNNGFDLNIDNYTLKELEELFELPSNYNEQLIDKQESKLRHNIAVDRSIVALTKNNTLDFINKVKKILVANCKQTTASSNTNIAKLAKNWENIYNTNKSLEPSDIVNAGNTNIIKRDITPYGQSSPSEFYQGAINPLNKRILRQNINIDTRFRENYYATTASNFHVDLPLRLTEVVSLQLSALELPNTLYAISSVFNNNYFLIEIPDENVAPLIVTIPDGNYEPKSLESFINHFIDTLAPAEYKGIKFLADITVSKTNGSAIGTGKMIVGAGTKQFSLNFLTDKFGNEDRQTPLPLKLGWLMGFRNGYYENNSTYVSEGVVSLSGPKYIYLVVDDFNNNVLDGFYGAFTSSVLNKNILARISLQGNVFNYVSKDNFNLTSTPRQYFGPVDIQKLQIQLLDEYGRIINLNNMDFSFCLTFQTVYDL